MVSYLESFCLAVEKDLVSREDALTLTDLDSGDLHPLDCHLWDPSSSEDSLCDLSSDDLSSSEFCDLLKDMSSDDWNQWLDDLMEDIGDLMEDPSSLEDSLYDLLKDMLPDDWAQVAEDMSFDLDDFVS